MTGVVPAARLSSDPVFLVLALLLLLVPCPPAQVHVSKVNLLTSESEEQPRARAALQVWRGPGRVSTGTGAAQFLGR